MVNYRNNSDEAEKISRKKRDSSSQAPSGISDTPKSEKLTSQDVMSLYHELEVHQIELEVQNVELQKAQVEIEALRAKYFDLYDMAPAGYLTINGKGLIIETNLTFAAMLNTTKKALVRHPFSCFIRPEDQDSYYLHRRKLFETGVSQVIQLGLLENNGAILLARMESTASQDADGAPLCRAIISDITEFNRAEKELDQLKEKELRIIIENLPQKVFLKDCNSVYLSCNKNYARDLKIKPEHIAGKTDYDFFPIELADKYRAGDKKIIESGKSEETEESYVENGKEAIIQTLKACFYDNNGRIAGVFCISSDITARKQTEKKIRESQSLLYNIINSSLDFIFVKDKSLRTILCNNAYAKAMGKRPDELYGKTDIENGWASELIKGNLSKGIRGLEQDDLDVLSGKTVHNSCNPANVGGDIRIFDTVKLPLKSSDGVIFGVLGISRDLTEHSKAEELKHKPK